MCKISLRNCLDSDCDYLLDLSNDPICRKNSFNTEFIDYDTHIKWFTKSMKNENRKIFIIMYGEKNSGKVMVDFDKNTAEISYTVDKKYRNLGIGSCAIRLSEEIIQNYDYITRVIAKVKKDNVISGKIFIKNNYNEYDNGLYLLYEKIIK